MEEWIKVIAPLIGIAGLWWKTHYIDGDES